MINDEKYSYVSELGVEILTVITSLVIVISVLFLFVTEGLPILRIIISDLETNLFLSSAYALFLPLMSYLFSQAKQNSSGGRAQVILIWMVLIEIIHIGGDPIFTCRPRKSAEQFIRLFWVGFLLCSYTSLHGIRVSLLVLCIYFGVYEVLKGILFYIVKDSYLIGKNPQIIHNYVKRIMLQDDLHTTPMNICDYIVMGEQNHEIDICSNGNYLGKKKPSSEGILTIGRVFQLSSSEDDVFTLSYPYWRDICLAHALTKMLRLRFAKLPVDEAGCRKSLDFVLQGIIDYIGSNQDIPTDENDGERNPTKRVFSIIQEELQFVYEFLNIRVPVIHYFPMFRLVDLCNFGVMLGNGIYLIYIISKKSSHLDLAITILLFVACYYIQCTRALYGSPPRWLLLKFVQEYIKDPTNSYVEGSMIRRLSSNLAKYAMEPEAPREMDKEARVYNYSSIVDLEAETIFYCITVDVSTLARLPKWIRRRIPRSTPWLFFSYADEEEVILKYLRISGGRLTNGETSLKNHGMDHLNWACNSNASTTETILVWHIATTFFHIQESPPHQNNDPHQEPAPQQNNNSFEKEQEVALALSSYCHYLVKYFPDLLPDKVDWTKKIYESVKEEILDIALFLDKKPNKEYRCNYALQAMWPESSVVGKGAMLAKDLMNCAEDEAKVWMMLADFWAEMMLFIAPSDNVDGHAKLLHREELITQLWALLTHAGITTRPKPTRHQDHEGESNV